MGLKSKFFFINNFCKKNMNDLEKPSYIELFSEKHSVIMYTSIPKVGSFKSKLMFKEKQSKTVSAFVKFKFISLIHILNFRSSEYHYFNHANLHVCTYSRDAPYLACYKYKMVHTQGGLCNIHSRKNYMAMMLETLKLR